MFPYEKAHLLELLLDEVDRLRKPNWYWDNNCLESSAESIEDATCEYDIGEVIELRPVHELPLIFVVRDDTGNEEFSSKEEAEMAAEKWSDA
jgi:hypothetical protein